MIVNDRRSARFDHIRKCGPPVLRRGRCRKARQRRELHLCDGRACIGAGDQDHDSNGDEHGGLLSLFLDPLMPETPCRLVSKAGCRNLEGVGKRAVYVRIHELRTLPADRPGS
jgi:hypothetical protein